MVLSVRDDGRRERDGRRRVAGAARVGLCSMTMLCLLASSGLAQAPEDGFRASVLDLSEQMERVTVPLNGSISVETTIEVVRADVINTQVVDVQVLSPKRLLITGQTYGTSSVVLLGKNDEQFVFEVSVELDLRRLNESIRQIDPLSDAKAESMLGHIVLTGTVSSAERADRIVELANLMVPGGQGEGPRVQNHMDVAGEQQVLLRVLVAEMNRTASRELGINGFLAGENAHDAFLINQIGGINPINIGAAADFPVFGNSSLLRQMFITGEDGIPVSGQSTLSLGFPKLQMQVFIRALADNSLLRILAEPNLVAISGETATFLAGGEFPIPVPQGDERTTIQFREFGVRLNFTPVVRGQDRIRLRVAPEVSELDFSVAVQIQGFVVPGLTSRASETTIELGSGETIAIAGLFREQVRGLASRVPGIGDVPILGALFRSVDFQRSMTELVILVTPEIVSPIDAHQRVRLPGEELKTPTDWELYLHGKLEGDVAADASDVGAPAGGTPQSDPDTLSLHGPWGHAGSSDMR